MARKLRALGYEVDRVFEFDRGAGVDLKIGFHRSAPPPGYERNPDYLEWLPVAIQCKASRRATDLMRGLGEALDGYPSAFLFLCFHSYHRPGHAPELRIAAVEKPNMKPKHVTWEWVVDALSYLLQRRKYA